MGVSSTNDAPLMLAVTSTQAAKIKDTQRPFRIWDTNKRANVPHRFYATEQRALDQALLLIRWGNVGLTYEVYDARTARFIAAYSRRIMSIAFTQTKRERA